jgi:hypothetical protein
MILKKKTDSSKPQIVIKQAEEESLRVVSSPTTNLIDY